MKQTHELRIGLIGFGEAGQTLAEGIVNNVSAVYANDIRLHESGSGMEAKMRAMGVQPVFAPETMGPCCDLVLSMVNSEHSTSPAVVLSPVLQPGVLYIDLTTSTPAVKRENEACIERGGGYFVDGAIMGTVAAEQHRVPIVVAGSFAPIAAKQMNECGLNVKALPLPNGGASSIKLLRSIFMKGLEALIMETMVAAAAHGVAEPVMESVALTMDGSEFRKFAEALIRTHVTHRKRRSKEIEDSIRLIAECGIRARATIGTADWFDWSKRLNFNGMQLEQLSSILETYLDAARGSKQHAE